MTSPKRRHQPVTADIPQSMILSLAWYGVLYNSRHLSKCILQGLLPSTLKAAVTQAALNAAEPRYSSGCSYYCAHNALHKTLLKVTVICHTSPICDVSAQPNLAKMQFFASSLPSKAAPCQYPCSCERAYMGE